MATSTSSQSQRSSKRTLLLTAVAIVLLTITWLNPIYAVDTHTAPSQSSTTKYATLTHPPVDPNKALPPDAAWSADDKGSVPYQKSPLTRTTPLADADETLFVDRCRAGGYPRVDTRVMPPRIAETAVHSELFLSDCDFSTATATKTKQHCDTVMAVRREVDLLDRALLSDPVIRRKHKTHRPKPGQGLAARGWGIAGPFTNKWIFYQRHLLAAQASPHRASLPGQTTRSGLHLCEVGFLAGHSTAIFSALLGHRAFASVHVFDLPQPGTGYSAVGMDLIRSRFEVESPATAFRFYATLSREGIHAAIATGRMHQCDFISLDGSKMSGDVIQDLRLMSHVAHPGSIVICDDMWTTKMLKAANAPEGAPFQVDEHNALLGAMIASGLIELVDVWHSDVDGWPAYGNVALRFNKFGRDFDVAAEIFMRKMHSTTAASFLPVPLPAAEADWVMAPTCRGEPVNALAHATRVRDDLNLPVTTWHNMRVAIDACVASPSVGARGRSSIPWKTTERCVGDVNKTLQEDEGPRGAGTRAKSLVPRRPLTGIVNPFNLGPNVLIWATSRARASDYAGVCFIDPPSGFDSNLGKVVASIAARRANGESTHVKVFSINQEHLPKAPEDQAQLERCTVNRVEGQYLATQFPPVPSEALESCGTVVLDVRTASPELVTFARDVLLMMTQRATKSYSMIVLHNINAAGVVGAIAELSLDMMRWRKWPRTKGRPSPAETASPAGVKGLGPPPPPHIIERIKAYDTAVGSLRSIEAELVSLCLVLDAYVAYGSLPLDPADGQHGTLVVTRKNIKLKTASASVFGWTAVTDIEIGPPD